uniref:MURF5 n=1 Tax=Leishmania peruviana TaxID=5681 RepID=A0A5H3CQY5_LEIPE|nr:TPA_asm: MURF5 [Leishmania peruviana]
MKMFTYKLLKKKFYFLNKINKFFNTLHCIDIYNTIYFNLNGILLWLNIIHINIILIKYSFLILLNNLEYLIISTFKFIIIYIKKMLSFRFWKERRDLRESFLKGVLRKD